MGDNVYIASFDVLKKEMSELQFKKRMTYLFL